METYSVVAKNDQNGFLGQYLSPSEKEEKIQSKIESKMLKN